MTSISLDKKRVDAGAKAIEITEVFFNDRTGISDPVQTLYSYNTIDDITKILDKVSDSFERKIKRMKDQLNSDPEINNQSIDKFIRMSIRSDQNTGLLVIKVYNPDLKFLESLSEK